MNTLTVLLLLISQYLNQACSTRLPLEVYELTPAAAAAAVQGDMPVVAAASTTAAANAAELKHKSLEYTTFDAKVLAAKQKAAATEGVQHVTGAVTLFGKTDRTTAIDDADLTVVSISAESAATDETDAAADVELGSGVLSIMPEHRRARQMLQQGLRMLGHQRYHKQQQQQQQQSLGNIAEKKLDAVAETAAAAAATTAPHGKEVRILYQIGESEAELPICAPNAVCSKIDLYETPWIERQCRCSESNHLPNVIIHHHHHHQHQHHQQQQQLQHNAETLNNDNNNNNNKYHSFYEKEKLMQHKRLLMGDYNDKKFESLHLKKLMQKLGAIYEDDLQLQPSDYLEPDYNDALPAAALEQDDFIEINDNEFPVANKHAASVAHMRHSARRPIKEPISYIGGCPSGLGIDDGHTIADKTRHYKLCQPVHKLPVCKHFRDYTWTLRTSADLNVTEQIVHCRCPKNSVTYLTKREHAAPGLNGYNYLFACSPLTRIRCQRKQPCKLFTVRKRQEFLDEVNINSLCQCPKGHHCPSHHTQSSVIAGESFLEDNIQTYSGYCMAND